MRSALSSQARRELVQQMALRYQAASRARKIFMLDAFVAITGYARTYAIQLLNHPETPKPQSQQARLPHYGSEVQQALLLAWKAANQICTKRLIPFLPTLVEALERHGHLHLTEECRSQLLSHLRHDGGSPPTILAPTGTARRVHDASGNPAQTPDSSPHLSGLE